MYEFDPQRLEKLDALRAAGVNPYPNGLPISHTLGAVREAGGEKTEAELEELPGAFQVAGRLRFKNEMGKAGFARIHDASGALQVYVRKDDIGAECFDAVWKKLDLGDQIWVEGRLMRTRTGELSLRASGLRLYSKCLESLPDKHKGFTDPELRRRMRYLDLFMNEDSAETFRTRSRIVRYIRHFFEDRDYLEVETPMLHLIPGGANARPFVTHHNALGMEMFLRIAPELYLKRLVVGGFDRVFEVNRNFRNEGLSQKHNPEFTMLEFYQAHATYRDLIELTETLVSGLVESLFGTTRVTFGEHTLDFARPWRRAPMAELIAEATGLDDVWDPNKLRAHWLAAHPDADESQLPTSADRWFELYFDAYVESTLVQPTFVTDFPIGISPLSRRSDADPRVAERFELMIAGWEIANGFSELNDPVDQAARFAAQVEAKAGGDEEAMYFDADYIRALSYAMPPTAGEGVGIDRLAMLLTNTLSIRDVILFPTLRPEAGRTPTEAP